MEKEKRLFTGSFIFRGTNEVTGYEVTDDFCYLNSPIVIANSFNVGRVYNAILSYGFSLNRVEIWPPYVIGVDDSYLNDMKSSSVDEKDVFQALHNSSSEDVEEGSVGIGLGLRAFGWKGGIGTSSRVLSIDREQFTCGILVATNHGNKKILKTDKNEGGSLIIVVAVDIPLVPIQIRQIVRSLVVSLSPGNTLNNCFDSIICVLFSTANPMSMENEGPPVYDFILINDSCLEKIIRAGAEAVSEAICNSLLAATPVQGRLGRKVETIPGNEFKKLLPPPFSPFPV